LPEADQHLTNLEAEKNIPYRYHQEISQILARIGRRKIAAERLDFIDIIGLAAHISAELSRTIQH
jgi:hypothetical protein